jgi:hypothetical protein
MSLNHGVAMTYTDARRESELLLTRIAARAERAPHKIPLIVGDADARVERPLLAEERNRSRVRGLRPARRQKKIDILRKFQIHCDPCL